MVATYPITGNKVGLDTTVYIDDIGSLTVHPYVEDALEMDEATPCAIMGVRVPFCTHTFARSLHMRSAFTSLAVTATFRV